MSPWDRHGIKDDRLGVELNRDGRTILIWTQHRRYFLRPELGKQLKLALEQIKQQQVRSKKEWEWQSRTEQLAGHDLGENGHHIKEFFNLKERSTSDQDWFLRFDALVADKHVWSRRTKPMLAFVISFKGKRPAVYKMITAKSRKIVKIQNLVWDPGTMLRICKEEDRPECLKHILRGCQELLGHTVVDLADALKPEVRQRSGIRDAEKCELDHIPSFLRPVFNAKSFDEGMKKVVGCNDSHVAEALCGVMKRLHDDKTRTAALSTLELAFVARRLITPDQMEALLLRTTQQTSDIFRYSQYPLKVYQSRFVPMRKQLKGIPQVHRFGWLRNSNHYEVVNEILGAIHKAECFQDDEGNIQWDDISVDPQEAQQVLVKQSNRWTHRIR